MERYSLDGEDQPFYKKWFGRESQNSSGYSDMEIGGDTTASQSYGLNDAEGMSLIDKAKDRAGKLSDRVTSQVSGAIDTGSNYYRAFACLCVGALFLLMALTCLPMVLISPNSFNLFFSIGSFFTILAMAFYYGPVEYLRNLFSAGNAVISVTYLTCLIFSIYFSIFNGAYLYSIIVCILQVSNSVDFKI